IWLCYCEGRRRDGAAVALGCSPGAVKGCLERGRERLRRRLARQGIALPAGLLFSALPDGAAGAVPPGLVQRTVAAAGSPPATVAALSRGPVFGRFPVRGSVIGTCAVVLVGLAVAVLPASPGGPSPSPEATDNPAPVAAADPQPDESKGARTITGTVIDPGGKPVPGAKVSLASFAARARPVAETTATADGSFRLTF